MGQTKKELIALKACGLRKGGRPAKVDAKIAKIKDEKVPSGCIKVLPHTFS